MHTKLVAKWAEIKESFKAKYGNDAGIMGAYAQTCDLAERRFYEAAQLGAEQLGITMDDFVVDTRFTSDAAIFGTYVLLDEAQQFVEGLTGTRRARTNRAKSSG